MPARLLCVLASALWLCGCYTAHDVDVDVDAMDESDAATDSAMTEDAGTDSAAPSCVASECPVLGFGAPCCTTEGTCGLDATAFGLGCVDPNSFGGFPGLPQ